MYVCVCVPMCACVCVCVPACMRVCLGVHVCACLGAIYVFVVVSTESASDNFFPSHRCSSCFCVLYSNITAEADATILSLQIG